MADLPVLLSDQEIQQFIVDGILLVRADFAGPVHQTIYQKLEEVFEKEGNPGNNILPRVPEIARVFDHPVVRGALTSLLGPGYLMNPHRHPHANLPGSAGQHWHKDCYVFDHNLRQPRFRWILALYYPQDVTEDMGPTGLLPRRHAYASISDADPARCREAARPLCGPAGTIALVNFDAWHRATANTSDRKRYMLKFQFARMVEPREPAWDHRSARWEVPVEARQEAVCRHVWDWLRGQQGPGAPASEARSLAALREGPEEERLRAAYELGARGASLVPALLDELRQEERAREAGIEARTPDNLHGTNPTASMAAQALLAAGPEVVPELAAALDDEHWLVRAAVADVIGSNGPAAGAAVDALIRRLDDPHWWVRRSASEALGRIGRGAGRGAGPLVARLADEDRRVRRMAALALAQLGTRADGALSALRGMLEDEDRYNRFYALLALRHLPDPEARDVLMDHLFTSRWCPITTPENRY